MWPPGPGRSRSAPHRRGGRGGGAPARPRARGARADVPRLDLAPDLLETARSRAADAGVEVAFEQGDAENLPYDDASFDTVSSSFGVMFAPDHAAAAGEPGRVG